ncbi:hypothetical protein Dsin_020475 [Dipteronia sinensis]|uniref:Reverse transcriptase domain-containing protein n=1 Tax=Dipteronia sinensis TaxID=43782 RepID=A0AAE0E501_9ROSI|nr:hypothetical protein Dsin_020475 [Dipteronia sinensis]
MNFMKEFHRDGEVVKDINRTFVTLIPKVGKLETIKDYRPISLVGSMYKILAKVLANRLRKKMNVIIGESQMAFVKGRQIIDSFVIAEEVIHKSKHEKEGGLLVKLDFEKAYNSVDHSFHDFMMEGMGFGIKWRGWMRECTSTPLVSELVNGRATAQFGLENGLRQGDPLSPFLFNIVVEGLNCLLKKATNMGLIEGERFDEDKVHISHLQFADDTILFIKPRMDYLMNAKRLLRCFELVSGLKINFHKSRVARVGIVKAEESARWATTFKCKTTSLPITYLGFPLRGKPGSKMFWNSLVDRIEKRLAPWKREFLSKGGTLVLIKAVISSMPTYFLFIFKIPVGWPKESRSSKGIFCGVMVFLKERLMR